MSLEAIITEVGGRRTAINGYKINYSDSKFTSHQTRLETIQFRIITFKNVNERTYDWLITTLTKKFEIWFTF